MSEQHSRKSTILHSIINHVDGFLVPISFGLVSMVIFVQVIATIPVVRGKIDSMEGRFSLVPAQVIPASVAQEQAQISLHLSPDQNNSGVQVFNNGKLVGTFMSSILTLSVHEGDKLTFNSPGAAGTVYIVVDHNDPNLLLPAPGQTVELTSQSPSASLPAVQFTH